MDTIGWISIFLGVWLLRAVIKGQVFDSSGKFVLYDNITRTLTDVITGNKKDLAALDSASGSGLNSQDNTDLQNAAAGTGQGGGSSFGNGTGADAGLLNAAVARGNAAHNRYVYAATGPDAYDCSGLVWRAIQDIRPDLKSLPRFSTFTMLVPPWRSRFQIVTDAPIPNDIVLWRDHCGIVSGPDTYYSARTSKLGIGYSKISQTFPNETPKYLRLIPSTGSSAGGGGGGGGNSW